MLTKTEAIDIIERAAWTFAQAFLAVLVVGDMSTARDAVIAGAAAAVSVLKSVAATKVKPETGAATL